MKMVWTFNRKFHFIARIQNWDRLFFTESDTMEATAQFDFNARSNRELSLRKGDLVTLRKQVSNDWWQGTVKGKDGLVPDKYISLKIK